MLLPMADLLKHAQAGQYGIPAVSATNELAFRAAVQAAEELHAPLITICMAKANVDLEEFGRIMYDIGTKSSVPIATCLDHGGNFEDCIKGLRAGFTAVMIDRSAQPYEVNARETKEMVRICHAVGVSVEAELGHVGSGDNYAVDGVSNFTEPDQALRFVEETGVDALAVAIGTAHGAYKGVPKLHFDLLEQIRNTIDTPLVLHGGSGSGDENLAKACKMGICKVNIANEMYTGAYKAVEGKMEGNGVYGLYPLLMQGAQDAAKRVLQLFGAAGKAWDVKTKSNSSCLDINAAREA